ncbi:hypothetical protein CAPTEDRAFT_208981 [Capitella teleta]|uniref:acylglycerol lipase n=1 Tax=Capitella teleta TaxID=283909 RepID=R7TX98_CAPTE|nr:hypothetical protein CAPTEDRAFT_208981 [Capitella teleta]|eukprot:ELT98558.1 hypothetical protein CAPTEDRAFT_208981 [Capitella teleta]
MALPAAVAMATTTALSAALWWYHYPELALQYIQHLGLYLAGMRVKNVRVRGLNICYAEKGQRSADSPSMLFVHGFSVNKEMWLPIIPLLPRNQHIVMLDLPGHGASDIPDDDMNIHISGMAEFVHEFVETIALNEQPFHIIGLSMGGAIVGLYSALYPKDIAILTTCCPAILTPEESPFVKQVREGNNGALLPKNVEDASKMFSMCCYRPWGIPRNSLILAVFMAARRRRQEFFTKLFTIITSEMDETSNELMQHVKEIQAECQVIWGVQDQILNVSGAEYLRNEIATCNRVDILEDCGHVIPIDRPFKMAQLLLEFRREAKI